MVQNSALYSRLSALRQQLAFEKRQPAYCVFSNKTLEEMANTMPTSMAELSQIYGVGNTKIKQYGDIFLAEIQHFKEENMGAESFSLTEGKTNHDNSTNNHDVCSLDIIVNYPAQKADTIIIDNYEELKASLEELLLDYDQILYTPAQLNKAKQDKATLNKLKKAISTRRKEIKDICLEPFYYVEAQLKELEQMIDIPLEKITQFTSEMEQVRRDTKSSTIKIYYDQVATILGPIADKVFYSEWFYDKKWENKTTPDWRWQKEIKQKINNVAQNASELMDKAGESAPAVIAKYIETGNKELAIQFFSSITSIMEGKSQEYEKTIEDNKKPTVVSQEVSEMLIRITGTSQQLQAVLQYIKGLGLKYDVFVGQ